MPLPPAPPLPLPSPASGGRRELTDRRCRADPYEEVKTRAQKKKEAQAHSGRDRREAERAGAIVGAPYGRGQNGAGRGAGRGPGGAGNGRAGMRGNPTHTGPRTQGPPANGGRAHPVAQKAAQARGGAPQRAQVRQTAPPQRAY